MKTARGPWIISSNRVASSGRRVPQMVPSSEKTEELHRGHDGMTDAVYRVLF